ncbi:class I SAM-dependent methyltransferase [Halomonas urumqiensis]|uniref:Ribosomal RNA small subunit methyltransferase C n=1 Tax=Halomonas urumqiensis TaxID=1684789 RepID=A0A2N7UCN0_9GAMM|nr:class I SAM-dependent methyltransferase [Halomonas urumqiensis]PMR78202.1 16S rRNA methyltransferase [Halomonas urumqiensis]PTB03350.1 class I SAM-dependent methyltransferase [Halomonas urumqiensis]GHE20484.1 ribosomal RNA small subunit methyltransferase C [Halomonas urumqiensis]
MSAETPVCQLLERQSADYRGWWWVAPPRDAWLEAEEGRAISADLGVLEAWRSRKLEADSPFETASEAPPGAVLFWPKSHALGEWWLLWLCATLPPGTPLQLVGENQGGIKRVLKALAALGLGCRKLDSARRCALYETRVDHVALEPDAAWTQFEAAGVILASHPGVFGHGKLDDGTWLLLETLSARLEAAGDDVAAAGLGEVLDLGCGDGILAAWLARRGSRVTATDINAFAVEATRRTLTANGVSGRVLQGDVYSALDSSGEGGRHFSAIVSNPPFHQERAIDYGPAARLILEAPGQLLPGGQLLLVANAFLPYPDLLARAFGDFEVLADDRRFRVYRAVKR